MANLKREGLERILSQLGISENDISFIGRMDRLSRRHFVLELHPIGSNDVRGFYVSTTSSREQILATLRKLGLGEPSYINSDQQRYTKVYYKKGRVEYELRIDHT